jgi:hypothetical protein
MVNPLKCEDQINENTMIPLTKAIRLMLFREIITVYCENYMIYIIIMCG